MPRFVGLMNEYGCHEGNYGMENLLCGARAVLEETPSARWSLRRGSGASSQADPVGPKSAPQVSIWGH